METRDHSAEVEEYLCYAYAVAYRIMNRHDDEVLSAAHQALHDAVRYWDPLRNVPLRLFIGVCVRRAVKRTLKKLARRKTAELVTDVEARPIVPPIDAFIDKLPECYRNFARDVFVHRKSLRMVCDETGRSMRWVRRRYAMVKSLMQALIEDSI